MVQRDGSAGGRRAAELATPSAAPDLAKNITIAAHVLVFLRQIVCDWVDPAGDEFPAGTTGTRDVAGARRFPHGYFEVPCYDETVAATCVEDTLWGRATDELGGSVECEGGDAEAMARSGIMVGLKTMVGIWIRVGD
jgi:hypothetical protein